MSSELYWDNLGVQHPDYRRNTVVWSTREMVNYLKSAAMRLSHRTYSFEFRIQGIVAAPASTYGLQACQNAKDIFLDSEMKRTLPTSFIVDRKDMMFAFPSTAPESVTIANPEGNATEIKLRVIRASLVDISPVDVSEEEEDYALDLLYDQSESVSDSVSMPRGKTMKIIEGRRYERTLALSDVPGGPTIVARYNTYILRREEEALETLALHPKAHHVPLLNLLQRSRYVEWEEFEQAGPIRYRVLTDDTREGTDEQRDFVRKALGTPDFAILEGPPGSGKTTTILELILQVVPLGKRVLLVASTHVAVDNVIEKLFETTTDGMSLAERYGVVPLRIGKKDAISDKVLRHHIDNFVNSEQRRIISFLERLPRRTEAQEMLYDALREPSRGREIIENLALESANLICGTTIGVLQSEIIRKSTGSKPAFDYLILDEASKTTFQEFLVPALHAARWILSGDNKQLSPYVDQVPIRENLSNLPTLFDERGREDKAICLDVFRAARNPGRSDFGKLVVLPEHSDIKERYFEQAKAVEATLAASGAGPVSLPIMVLQDRPSGVKEKLQLMGSAIVMVPQAQLQRVSEVLPPHLVSNANVSETFSRRRQAFLTHARVMGPSVMATTGNTWEDEVAWRVSRLYELREVEDKQAEHLLNLQLLLPHFERPDWNSSRPPTTTNGTRSERPPLQRSEVVLNEVRKIERMALPSVLELLQTGYRQNQDVDEESRLPLYDGLPAAMMESRHTLLRYQHRMHPDISRFPRAFIYTDMALNDPRGLAEARRWSYDMYSHRVVWVNTLPTPERQRRRDSKSNYNQAEVKVIIGHLKRFMAWSKQNPPLEKGSEGNWQVALLSFYKGQENRLSEALRVLFNSRSRRYFQSAGDHLKVEVCTVDRFQGHEADIVFLSMVNTRYRIGFLDNPNRLNVALTRAKYQVVIVGDRKTFKDSRRATDLLRSLESTTPEGPLEFDA